MVAPRLISELQGPAKRLVIGKKPDWVSFPGGVRVLLNTLRASLGKPQVSEMADYLTKYFRQTRRKAQESMSDYITRKCEVYLRAQQALRRVLPQHQKPKTTVTPTGSTTGEWGYPTWSRRTSAESSEGTSQAAAPGAEASAETEAEEERSSQDDQSDWWRGRWWQPGYQSWYGGWYGYQSYGFYDGWKTGPETRELKGVEEDETTEILPDFVQGWYLLFDASLNTTERNLIHTAVQGDYSLQRIAQELRSQWDDNNIRQRDGRQQNSYQGEYEALGSLSAGRASQLENQSWELVPSLFQDLVGFGRAVLLEVGGEPNSHLTTAVQDLVGHAGAAKRLSIWNGADLSSSEGVKFVLRQIRLLRPGLVWLAPSDTPFSPLQHTNSRTEAQKEELLRKRGHARKCYAGASIIYRYCVQLGVHCVWSMSEKSDAWRLPVMQQLLTQTNPKQAITHGCQVELRGSDNNRLIRKGWKLITTHTRLAQIMDRKCTCPKDYVHGRCEGESASRSGQYTQPYAQRAAEAITQELRHVDVTRECQGYSTLPEGFGEGGACECHKGLVEQGLQCGWCLQGRIQIFEEDPGIQGDPKPQAAQDEVLEPEPVEDNFNAQEVIQAEEKARELLEKQDFSEDACLGLIKQMPLRAHNSRPGKLGDNKVHYHLFGSYAHGAQYGVSNRTKQLQKCTQYLNKFLGSKMTENRRWTSLVVSRNNSMPIHRDVNNETNQPNMVFGLGNYTGGGLWVQETIQAKEMGLVNQSEENLTKRTTPHGETIWGRSHETKGRVVTFPPKAWHETEQWRGERVMLSAYTSRGQEHLGQRDLEDLRRGGFPLPPRPRRASLSVLAVEGSERDRKKEEERIKRQLYLLHAATGHCSTQHLVTALKRRNAKPEVLKLATEFRCSICEERQKVQPRHLASLEPLPPKFHTVSADVGHWTHPESKEHFQFLVIIDEGSRFRIARIVSQGPKQQPSGATSVQYLREAWAQVFGNPRTLRLDPAGSFRSQAVKDYCDRHQIFLDLVPGEAHWKVGPCEQAVQGLKTVMDKLCQAETTLAAEEALATAVRIFNQRDLVRGFSPAQHVLGQAPDETGRVDVAVPAVPPEFLVENPGTEFSQSVARRAEAEKAHADWNARQRLVRAANSRSRRVLDYYPGELVYFWRQQDSSKNRQGPHPKRGYFMGPARILATETKRNPDGTLQPRSAVWCVRGRQLVKCCVEQLRKASPREELIEALTPADRTPWTFTKVSEQIGGNQYEDVSSDSPHLEEWLRAQQPEEEQQPSRRRVTFKRPAPAVEPSQPSDSEEELIPVQEDTETSRATAGNSRASRRPHPYGHSAEETGERWWDKVSEEVWFCTDSAYWSDQRASVQVEVEMPESNKGWTKALQNFEGYMVSAMRRRAVEVRERYLTDEEKLQFQGAKAVEVKNFVAAKAFESVPEHLRPSKEQAIGMRWILTWKQKEDGTLKAKARAVLLGFQDPSYEHRQTTAPVMLRQSRQMLLQQAARRQWTVYKGDVSGAFLQGREYPGVLHCVPCDEICDALNVPRASVMRLRRACYGLVDAPLEWYKSVDEFLEGVGLQRTWSDPCTWVWRVQDELRGMISGHVDDFMFGGSDQDREWQDILQKIKARFKWGDWERDTEGFTQCGVRILRTSEGYQLSQPQFIEGLQEIPLNASRRKDRKAHTSESEKTQLRALLGSLSWMAQQSSPHISASVSLLLSEVSTSTVDTVIRTNCLASQVKKRKDHIMLIHSYQPEEPLALYAWVDAASANRPDGGSTQGIFIGIGPQDILQGAVGRVTPISWHSSKVDRVCRSPGAAEAQAAVNGEDSLYFARYQWSELEYGNIDPRDAQGAVRKVPGCLITDSRNVYDKLNTEMLTVKGAEKRTDLEMIGLKEAQRNTALTIRWVHSEAQLANSLTKSGGGRELELYYQMQHQWRIVEDKQMRSARRRKQDGVAPLATGERDE